MSAVQSAVWLRFSVVRSLLRCGGRLPYVVGSHRTATASRSEPNRTAPSVAVGHGIAKALATRRGYEPGEARLTRGDPRTQRNLVGCPLLVLLGNGAIAGRSIPDDLPATEFFRDFRFVKGKV